MVSVEPRTPSRSAGRAALLRGIAVPALAVAVLQVVVTLLFAWPAAGSAMHGLPFAVAGPDAVAEAASRSLSATPPGALHVVRIADGGAARKAVLDRQVYGALVIENDGLRLLVASGASPVVAQSLLQAVDRIQAQAQGTYLEVEDLAPNPARDPRGQAPGAALLALLVTSVAGGVVVFRVLGTAAARLGGLAALAVGGGLGSATVLHGVLGALPGAFLPTAGVLVLAVLATAGLTTAFAVVADLPGAAFAALLVVAAGYPISGVTSAPELVPAPWDAIGRLLPAGAGGTALRGAAFFSGAGLTTPILILCAWVVAAALVIAGSDRRLFGGPVSSN